MSADGPGRLTVDGVSVRYGARTVVHEVTFSVGRGEVVALAGPNGSGKSTLLRAATGLLTPSAGTVRFPDGSAVRDLDARARARRLAWMPQEEPPGDNVPLAEYVGYGRYAYRSAWSRPSSRDAAAVDAALQDADLGEDRTRGVLELSGGERQRARLARALAQETDVLLLDEPTAHLDVGHQLDVLGRVRRIARGSGRAVVVALHDLNLAARFSDRIVVLSHGRRVAAGPPEEVLSASLLERVWGIVAEMRRDRATGLPYLLPRLPSDPVPQVSASGPRERVHVVAGGGSGAELFGRLLDAGFDVTAGVLPLFDTDEVAARELGVPAAVELPFAPIGSEALARLAELTRGASAILVAPFPVGPTNVENLEALSPIVATTPVLLVALPQGRRWDYAEGRGTRAREALVAAGAVVVPDAEGALAWLAAKLPRSRTAWTDRSEGHDADPDRAPSVELRE